MSQNTDNAADFSRAGKFVKKQDQLRDSDLSLMTWYIFCGCFNILCQIQAHAHFLFQGGHMHLGTCVLCVIHS